MTWPQRSAPVDVVTVGELKEYLAGCASDRVLWVKFPPDKVWYTLAIVGASSAELTFLHGTREMSTVQYLASILEDLRDDIPLSTHYRFKPSPEMTHCKGLTLIKVPEFTLPWVPAWLFCVPAYIEVTLGSVRANITAEARRL